LIARRARSRAPEARVAIAEAADGLLQELDAGLVDDAAPRPEQARALTRETECAAGEERRVAQPSRDVGGFPERLARPAPVGGSRLCLAAGEQELAALALVCRSRLSESVERVLEVRRRRLVAERRRGVAPRSRAVDDRLAGAPAGAASRK